MIHSQYCSFKLHRQRIVQKNGCWKRNIAELKKGRKKGEREKERRKHVEGKNVKRKEEKKGRTRERKEK